MIHSLCVSRSRGNGRGKANVKKYQVLPGLEPGSKDSESLVMTITLQDLGVAPGASTPGDLHTGWAVNGCGCAWRGHQGCIAQR